MSNSAVEELKREAKLAIEQNSNEHFCRFLELLDDDASQADVAILQNVKARFGQTSLTRHDKNLYRNSMKRIIEKIELSINESERTSMRQKLATYIRQNPDRAINIAMLILAVFTLVFGYVYWQHPVSPPIPQKTASLVMSDVSAFGFNIFCDMANPEISFTVTNTGEIATKTDVRFAIILINQTSTSCSKNVTLFQTRPLCSLTVEGNPSYSFGCGYDIPPITTNTQPLSIRVTEVDFAKDIEKFVTESKKYNLTECRMSELIQVCPIYENSVRDCSKPIDVNVTYRPCT